MKMSLVFRFLLSRILFCYLSPRNQRLCSAPSFRPRRRRRFRVVLHHRFFQRKEVSFRCSVLFLLFVQLVLLVADTTTIRCDELY